MPLTFQDVRNDPAFDELRDGVIDEIYDAEIDLLRRLTGYTETLQIIEESPEMAKRIRRQLRKWKPKTIH